MKQLNLIFIAVALVFSCQSFADNEDQFEKSNKSYYKLLTFIEVEKDKNLSSITREDGIKNIIDLMGINGPAANWLPLKDGLFDIMIDDPNFFFNSMLAYPA